MNNTIKQLYNDYQFARSNNLAYLKSLSETDLQKQLARPGLNTFTKHFEELLDFELDIIEAIQTGTMAFTNSKDVNEYKGETKKVDLLEKLTQADKELLSVLNKANDDLEIHWNYVNIDKSLVEHISFLISHETLHLGQFIAFSYTEDFKIPSLVKNMWAIPQ